MTFVTFSNLIVICLCAAVIVQSRRMAKSIRDIRSSPLNEGVAQLDRAAGQARAVLNDLKALLAADVAAQGRVMASAEALRDELSLMVGIGNAVAERILAAAAAQKQDEAVETKEPEPRQPRNETAARRQGSRKTRSRAASARRKPAAETVVVTADTPVAGHA